MSSFFGLAKLAGSTSRRRVMKSAETPGQRRVAGNPSNSSLRVDVGRDRRINSVQLRRAAVAPRRVAPSARDSAAGRLAVGDAGMCPSELMPRQFIIGVGSDGTAPATSQSRRTDRSRSMSKYRTAQDDMAEEQRQRQREVVKTVQQRCLFGYVGSGGSRIFLDGG